VIKITDSFRPIAGGSEAASAGHRDASNCIGAGGSAKLMSLNFFPNRVGCGLSLPKSVFSSTPKVRISLKGGRCERQVFQTRPILRGRRYQLSVPARAFKAKSDNISNVANDLTIRATAETQAFISLS